MTSQAVRDPIADHLITPQNAALVLIDDQPSQFATVRSMDQDLLRENIVSTVKTARAFGLPIIHSTVNVASGQQQPTVPELAGLLEDSPPLDRTTVNSWEDSEFVQAVHETRRRKLIFCALWTEVCMAFTALDAIREGYEVYPVVDARPPSPTGAQASGGSNRHTHRARASTSSATASSTSTGPVRLTRSRRRRRPATTARVRHSEQPDA